MQRHKSVLIYVEEMYITISDFVIEKMSKALVVTGERNLETVYRALDGIDFEGALSEWDRLLIKVNFATTKAISPMTHN